MMFYLNKEVNILNFNIGQNVYVDYDTYRIKAKIVGVTFMLGNSMVDIVSGDDCRDTVWESQITAIPTFKNIKDNKLTCWVVAKNREQAMRLQNEIKISNCSSNFVINTWDRLFGTNTKYKNHIAYNIKKGVLDGYCHIDYYMQNSDEYGIGYELEDIISESNKYEEDNEMKFKVGDKVIGNEKADATYAVTRKGWTGVVVNVFKTTIEVRGKGRTCDETTYVVDANCFDLCDNNVSYGTGGFAFTTVEGERYVSHGKHKGEAIPTITTTVYAVDYSETGSATCDKSDYNKRQGILEAIANMVCDGNFDREYNKILNNQKKIDDRLRKCSTCGKTYKTKEEARACEQAHIDRKKAKRENYLMRKAAKKRAREMQVEQMAKDILKGSKI